MNLPEGTRLAYIVSHEAYYSTSTDRRELWVSADHEGGGCSWSFTVESHSLSGERDSARVCVFDDGFAAFADIPEFFAELSSPRAKTLEEVRAVLDRLGAADATPRYAPGEKSGRDRVTTDIQRILDRSAGRPTADIARDITAVLGAAGKQG